MPTKPGTILWASVADPNSFVKDRPLVVLSVGTESNPQIVCVCITTREKNPVPTDYLKLGWSKNGLSMTGLMKKSWAVTKWIVVIRRTDIRRQSGLLNPKQFAQLMALVTKHSNS